MLRDFLRAYFIKKAKKAGLFSDDNKDCIVFFGHYPLTEKEAADGYCQRILAIDDLFPDFHRIYINIGKEKGFFIETHNGNTVAMVSRINFLSLPIIIGALFRATALYVHSIHSIVLDIRLILFLLFSRKAVIDLHGAVPEELAMQETSPRLRVLFSGVEWLALNLAPRFVAVTQAMCQHFRRKYKRAGKKEWVVLPIFNSRKVPYEAKAYNIPSVVYAGGIQPWQNIPQMLSIIRQYPDIACYHIYLSQKLDLDSISYGDISGIKSVKFGFCQPSDMPEMYGSMHFGFILRSNSIVNRVACPTKLIEYLANGVVPIMDFPEIGDFLEHGMRYVSVDTLEKTSLPDVAERERMAQENFLVLDKIAAQSSEGKQKLVQLMEAGRLQNQSREFA